MITEEKLQQAAEQYDRTAYCGQFAGEDPSYHYLNGAKSPESLEYWKEKEKLYSEEELYSIMQQYLDEYVFTRYEYITPMDWLKQNKKK